MPPTQRLAASLVVMIAAGGAHDEVVAIAQTHGILSVDLRGLTVPDEQEASRQLLMSLLERKSG